MKSIWIVVCGLMTAFLPSWARAASPQEVAESGLEGYRLFVRDSLPDDRDRGYEMMLSAAWEGDAKSANNVGWLLQQGEYVERDLPGALRWYERAADQGLPAAALNYVELLLNYKEEALGTRLPDRERLAKAASLAGTAMLMGRGLPYDAKRGEDFLLRGALFGDERAAMTVAQQLEMYPDSFSYLPLEDISKECDALLAPDFKNIPAGMSASEFADLMLTPQFWYDLVEGAKRRAESGETIRKIE